MQADPKVIEYLNAELKNELTAVHQYLLHARLYKNWGLEELGAHEYNESMDELTHADKLIERILMLDGLPNLQDATEDHIDWLETQIGLIDKIGIQNYQQSGIHKIG